MSVTGKLYDPNSGVRRVILASNPQLHPFSNVDSAPNNYYCLANDMKGFQVEIDLQALPPGITLSQLAPNQVWWVEKITTLYRIFLYGGTYDPKTRQINSTAYPPGYGSAILLLDNDNSIAYADIAMPGATKNTMVFLTPMGGTYNASPVIPAGSLWPVIYPGVGFKIVSSSTADANPALQVGWHAVG